jgi:hypothetical protein
MKWNPRARLGPDEFGRYPYLADPSNLIRARSRAGHTIRSQADLQDIGHIVHEEQTLGLFKPQTYVVTLDHLFVLGGHLNEHVEAASGQPVLAAGEATIEEQPDGTWRIAELNNRSYGYMPEASSWQSVDRALTSTGIEYPRGGFTEVYPHEGSWADVLTVLLA